MLLCKATTKKEEYLSYHNSKEKNEFLKNKKTRLHKKEKTKVKYMTNRKGNII